MGTRGHILVQYPSHRLKPKSANNWDGEVFRFRRDNAGGEAAAWHGKSGEPAYSLRHVLSIFQNMKPLEAELVHIRVNLDLGKDSYGRAALSHALSTCTRATHGDDSETVFVRGRGSTGVRIVPAMVKLDTASVDMFMTMDPCRRV